MYAVHLVKGATMPLSRDRVLRAAVAPVRLREHVEHALDGTGRQAHAVIGDRDERVAALGAALQHDAAAGIGVARGVVEQVGQHLRHAHRVGMHPQRLRRQAHLQ